jgi:hypothetical protein
MNYVVVRIIDDYASFERHTARKTPSWQNKCCEELPTLNPSQSAIALEEFFPNPCSNQNTTAFMPNISWTGILRSVRVAPRQSKKRRKKK